MKFASYFPFRFLSALCIVSGLASVLMTGCSQTSSPASSARVQTPAPPSGPPPPPPLPPLPQGGVRGLYLTGWGAGHTKMFQQAVAMVDRTELNALVIDVMDDGMISYDVDVPLARQVGANQKMIPNIDKVLDICKQHNIWPIARVTCFRDRILPKKRPELAILRPDRKTVWSDPAKHTWLNPFNKEAWEYPLAVARDAVRRGFKEIQFDYIRFPSEGAVTKIYYAGRPDMNTPEGKRRNQIEKFVQYAASELRKEGVWVSADVFGEVSITREDMGIGQTATNIARHVDYLCPMVYPSHYNPGTFGANVPNAQPYRMVFRSLQEHQKKFKAENLTTCKFRPWLQAFTLGAPPYSAPELKAQLKALRELGIKEYLLWNASFEYRRFEAALPKAEASRNRAARR